MSALRFLGITGSLRRKSTNLGLLRAAQSNLPSGVDFDIADLSDIPFYNTDLPEKPKSVIRVLSQLDSADAFVIASPEYNFSIAPALKNILDWASREPNNHLLSGKSAALMSSGGGMGGARAQYHLRQVAVYLNLHIINKPEIFVNAFTDNFDVNGNLINEKTQSLISEQMIALTKFSMKLNTQL